MLRPISARFPRCQSYPFSFSAGVRINIRSRPPAVAQGACLWALRLFPHPCTHHALRHLRSTELERVKSPPDPHQVRPQNQKPHPCKTDKDAAPKFNFQKSLFATRLRLAVKGLPHRCRVSLLLGTYGQTGRLPRL